MTRGDRRAQDPHPPAGASSDVDPLRRGGPVRGRGRPLPAGLLIAVDRRALWAAGAAVQPLVIALFVMFGVGVFGPGVFEYEALSDLPMEVWAAGITGIQVILFGLLCYLALAPTEPGPPARPNIDYDRRSVRRHGTAATTTTAETGTQHTA